MSNRDQKTSGQLAVEQEIERAISALSAHFPGPSRAKALVQTKLDEARLWLAEAAEGK